MSEIVFILGAGASKHCGAPLMGEFLDRADNLRREGGGHIDHEAFNRVFNAVSELQKVHSKATLDLDNLESVFGAFEMAQVIGLFPGLSGDAIPQLNRSFRKVIAQTLEETVGFVFAKGQINPPTDYHNFADLISDLGSGRRRRTCSIITFNYDVALDYALHFNSVPFSYGLEQGDTQLPYLKLHGSLNWVQTTETPPRVVAWPVKEWSAVQTLHLDEKDLVRYRVSRQLEHQNPALGQFGYDFNPVIIPPTWNKTAYQANLANVWQRAARELADAQQIFVSGYSLIATDAYFRYLFALGAVAHPVLRDSWWPTHRPSCRNASGTFLGQTRAANSRQGRSSSVLW